MKKYIYIAAAILALVLVNYFIGPHFISYQSSDMHRKQPPTINSKQGLEDAVKKYCTNIPKQTPFYYQFEFVHIETPNLSVAFAITSKSRLGESEKLHDLNGNTVNLISPINKYVYKYRAVDRSSDTETSGKGEFVWEINGNEKILSITGLDIALSPRNMRSFRVDHPPIWDVTAVELGRFDEWPIQFDGIGSNQSLNSMPQSGAN